MKFTYVVLLLSFTHFAFAQINQTDDQGRKQGVWKKKFEEANQLRYQGEFIDDVPVGKFIYYHINGRHRSVIEYRGQTGVGYATMYDIDGWKMAEGLFKGQQRDSIWSYYGPDGDLVSTIPWKDGKKHGVEKIFYGDGSLAERIEWEFGVKQGLWVRKYPDGSVRSRGTYTDDKLDGEMRYFDQAGELAWFGHYVDGLKHGNWYIFENGSEKIREVYEMGELVDAECLIDDCPDMILPKTEEETEENE